MLNTRCSQCQGELTQRSRLQLFLVGVLMCAGTALTPLHPLIWIPAIILALAGVYLIVWATLARGLWCRQCKKFPL